MVRRRIDRILVATDGSEESIEAAEYAAELVRRLKARVTLIHVVPTPSIPVTPSIPFGTTPLHPEDNVEIEKAMWEGAQVILDRTRVPFDQEGISVEGVIRRGEAADEILSLLQEEDFDLVVMSSHGAGGAERAVLGSTSDAVVRAAPCPVLIVRKGTAN